MNVVLPAILIDAVQAWFEITDSLPQYETLPPGLGGKPKEPGGGT